MSSEDQLFPEDATSEETAAPDYALLDTLVLLPALFDALTLVPSPPANPSPPLPPLPPLHQPSAPPSSTTAAHAHLPNRRITIHQLLSAAIAIPPYAGPSDGRRGDFATSYITGAEVMELLNRQRVAVESRLQGVVSSFIRLLIEHATVSQDQTDALTMRTNE